MIRALNNELMDIVGRDRLLTHPEKMAYATKDMATNVEPAWPAFVVKVCDQKELIKVTQACLRYKQALVIRAAGSGKSGGATPYHGAAVIDVSGLDRIINIDKANLIAEVEPGVILAHFQQAVRAQGLFYPVDPASASLCTLGGNVAENASGPSTVKYGCTRDYVLGGQAILGTGEVIEFGKSCIKGVTGYDIASLLCGSEGTLAVFTSLLLRLLPHPRDEAVGLFLFENDRDALSSVLTVFAHGFLPRTIEYIDATCLQALIRAGFRVPGAESRRPALLLECDASLPGHAVGELKAIEAAIRQGHLCQGFLSEADGRGEYLWRMRAGLSAACTAYLGHKLSEDIELPLGKMYEFACWFKEKETDDLRCALFGHAGDGNFHVQILFDHPRHRENAQKLRHEVLLKVLNLGGTLSAEHGIGRQKIDYMPLEQSPALIEVQRRIKGAFDPYNLINPGKIFGSRQS